MAIQTRSKTSSARASDVPSFKMIAGKRYQAVSRYLQSKNDASIEASIHREHYKGYAVSFRVVEVTKGKYAGYKFDSR